jgi:midasin
MLQHLRALSSVHLSALQLQRGSGDVAAPVFAFVEGALVAALREGSWILLDEINLAPNETLERLAGVLEVRLVARASTRWHTDLLGCRSQGPQGSVTLTERGDIAPVPRHPRFRLFGAMNHATDTGKRDLPAGIKARCVLLWALFSSNWL